MTTGSLLNVHHGFVVVRSDGRLLTKDLYRRRAEAESVARIATDGFAVRPARRVVTVQNATSTTGRIVSQLIFEEQA